MEGIRLDRCGELRVLVNGLRKLSRDLVEASERTPPTITSRQLLEDSYRLAYSLLVVAHRLFEESCH